MEILNALDLQSGKKSQRTSLYGYSQPLQFIPKKKKNKEWAAWNMDYLELQGVKQIKQNARRFLKNYKLAEGIIDKSDYIPENDNDMESLVSLLSHDNDKLEVEELKFYPIIPNVVNTLIGEFSARDKKVSFQAIDEYTYNEKLELKRQEIETVLTQNAQMKMIQNLIDQGMDPNDPDIQEQLQQQISPENLRTLPEIQDFYNKSYQVICEKWATRQYNIDSERLHLDEKEVTAFKDKIVTSREFWHFKMYEDDYDVEIWDPCLTFYQKSPQEQYISNASYVGMSTIMTVADVIDSYGWKMTEKQLSSLEESFITDIPGYSIAGVPNDGSFYDATRSYEWNHEGPSLGMRQFMSVDQTLFNESDIVGKILNEGEDPLNISNSKKILRVTTAYWKSQLKLGYLTKICDDGSIINDIVTEDYQILDKPVYDTEFIKDKRAENLIYGEHVEWIWINQVWGGIKIGPNTTTLYGIENNDGISPIYLGINDNEIKPLKFQFKGDNSLYGCKLPVEGRIFTDRNTKSMSVVDKLKPFQIGYNIVNNQISDILAAEIGTVVLFDQNALPKHSLGEDWGKANIAKAYTVMKDYGMMPLDTSIMNTENGLSFQHYQQLDLSQTQRIMSRMQLAQYFKQQAYELMGVSPQRMGQPIGQKISATEAEQIQVSSFSQTEQLFTEHTDYLMPRVHQMRTDLAQWYAVQNPSVRMRNSISEDERVNFEVNRNDLLLRDINVYCTAKANIRKILEQLKQFAIQNNTAGASMYDVGQILQADSLGTLNAVLKATEEKQQQLQQQQLQQQQEMEQQRQQAELQEKQMEFDFKAQENEADRRNAVLIAEIKASGYGAMQDINQNGQSDFMDSMDKIRKTDLYADEVSIKRDKANAQQIMDREKLNLKREELQLKRETNETNMAIARENKNRYDFPGVKIKEKDNKGKDKK